MPKFSSGNQRLRAAFDAYCELIGKRPVTMDEVSRWGRWALVSGLYPVPKRGCGAQAADAWEQRLAAAKQAWLQFTTGSPSDQEAAT